MGRTFGPDLIIPTVQRQHFYNPQEQEIYYPNTNHLLQQQQQQQEAQQHQDETGYKRKKFPSSKDSKIKVNGNEQEQSRPGQNSNSEIKFSIDRILSNDCSNTVKEVIEEKVSENEEEEDEDDEDMECNTDDIKAETDTDESIHYEWLQCTRYKPPKLQRKLFSYLYIVTIKSVVVLPYN